MNKMKPAAWFGVFMMLITTAFAQNTDEVQTVQIDTWLKSGNYSLMLPVYESVENVKGEAFGYSDLLKYAYLDAKSMKPAEGDTLLWHGEVTRWEEIKTAKNGFARAARRHERSSDQLTYFAAYISTDRWMDATIHIKSPQLFQAFLNGKPIATKSSLDAADASETGGEKKSLDLERGKHLLLIKSVKPEISETDWEVKAEITFDSYYDDANLRVTTLPKEIMNIHHLLEGEFVDDAEISPDGNHVLMKFSEVKPPEGDRQRWMEVRNLETGRMIHSFRHAKISSAEWAPVGNVISYRTSDKNNGSSIWLFDLDKMTDKKILSDVEDLGNWQWAPDGSFIIYSIGEESEENDEGLKRYEGMPDRWPWWRSRSFLYQLDVESGITRRLTHGHVSTGLQDISPDGSKLLFSQSIPNFSKRPYSEQVLVEMDLQDFSLDTIWVNNMSGNCSYSPDGTKLLVLGSPALFGDMGINLSEDLIPNDYDTQAYLYDLATGDVDPISFNFDPAINSVEWSRYDKNRIYFLASDRTYRKVFVYDLNTRYFEEVPAGFDVVSSFSLAHARPLMVCTGSDISTPPFASKVTLDEGNVEVIADPRAAQYREVVFGKTEEWNFVNDEGTQIEGRIYFPPDFDKSKKYPLIVYYYAGTSPTERSFGGRYPMNIFAAQGYVIYNLQPSGATGYGQEFSAAHVNNWGITVADEIIKGTEHFLEDHDFVDPDKVGCIGASYGGFMTMLLQTRTDLFAAAISHAGISSISSYWGEGYWGYLYNAVAAAENFPWNNPDLYVEQSALFNADKIETPLLLLHGGSDTNVPIGESIQLYTALKLLDKPVEMIEVAGQDHHILDYKKRIKWQKTIFAWFDFWLKDQPEWWYKLYPERNL